MLEAVDARFFFLPVLRFSIRFPLLASNSTETREKSPTRFSTSIYKDILGVGSTRVWDFGVVIHIDINLCGYLA